MDLGKCPSCGTPWKAGDLRCSNCKFVPIGAEIRSKPAAKKKERKWWEPVHVEEQKLISKKVIIDFSVCPQCNSKWEIGKDRCAKCGFEPVGAEKLRFIQQRGPRPRLKDWKPLKSFGIPGVAAMVLFCGAGSYFVIEKLGSGEIERSGHSGLLGLLAIDPTYDSKAEKGQIFGIGTPVGPDAVATVQHADFSIMSANPESFKVNSSATSVSFSFMVGDQPKVATFSLENRAIKAGTDPSASSAPVQIGIPLENWKDSSEPTLSGKKLKMEGDTCRCLAISQDRTFFLGCDSSIKKFKEDGTLVWSARVSSPVCSVNLTKNGATLIAAFSDGTIRWIREKDHQDLMVLFVKQDQSGWAIWTHEGFYDCSPGADGIAGLNLSAGPGAPANFFPLSSFRDSYYRPDIIKQVLTTNDVMDAAKQVAAQTKQDLPPSPEKLLPPIVRITNTVLSDSDGNGAVIHYNIESLGKDPVLKLVVQVDGRPVKDIPAEDLPPAKDGIISGDISLDMAGGTKLSVIAENSHAWSVANPVDVMYKGSEGKLKKLTKPQAKPKSRTLYVLAAGVNKTAKRYADLPLLRYSVKDAVDFTKVLVDHKGDLFGRVVPISRTDAKATAATLRQDISGMVAQAKRNDVIVVFLSGHGLSDARFDYHFVTSDYDPERLDDTTLTRSDLEVLSGAKANVVFFIDTCHSGRAIRAPGDSDITKTIDHLSSPENGAIVFSACQGNQQAGESEAWGNGAFTKAAIIGISGKGDAYQEGQVFTDFLGPVIAREVRAIVGDADPQTPYFVQPPTVPAVALAVVSKKR